MEQSDLSLRHVMSAGTRLAVFDSGGPGTPILFTHGNSSSMRAFRAQCDGSLAPHRIVAFDFAGHGRSHDAARPPSEYSARGLAASITDVVSALGLRRPIIAGWSLGGDIAIQYAAQGSEIGGLVLVGTAPLKLSPTGLSEAFVPSPALSFLFSERVNDEQIEQWTSSVFVTDGPDRRQYAADFRRADGRCRAELGAAVARGDFADEVDALAKLAVPVAFVTGDREPVINVDYLHTVRLKHAWRGGLHTIPGAAHAPQLEAPHAFNALISSFVADATKA